MPPHARSRFIGVFDTSSPHYQQRQASPPPTVPQHQQHDVLIKEAKQRLDASMDVIFRVLQTGGVSPATIAEFRLSIAKEQHLSILKQAQTYMMCLSSTHDACCLLIAGWEALDRLHFVRQRRALKVVRNMRLVTGVKETAVRKANLELCLLSEAHAASQLGLYKANAWKNRMEQGSTRSLSI